MNFEWDKNKSLSNKNKHGIDFNSAMEIWNDIRRVEIEAYYPLENRGILAKLVKDIGPQFLRKDTKQ